MADTTRAETLIADIERLASARCACAAPFCGHVLLFSFLLGYKSELLCVACLAKELGRDVASLSAHLVDWVQHRDCYLAAWDWTSAREGDCPLASLVPLAPPARRPLRRPPSRRNSTPETWAAVTSRSSCASN